MFFVCAVGIAKADVEFYVDSIQYCIAYPAAPEAKVIDYIGHATDLVIPSSVTYNGRTYTVTDVYLRGNMNIVNITLPNTITELQFGAFAYCENLQSFVLPDGMSIPECCFAGCSSLSSIDVHGSVGSGAFSDCTGLIFAKVDGAVGSDCFSDCTNLQSASIMLAREGTCGAGLFENCVNLRVVNLGYVNRIHSDAFRNCRCIDTIKVLSSDPPSPYGNEYPFTRYVDVNTTIIIVPCNTGSTYAQRGAFRDFWNIIEDCSENTIIEDLEPDNIRIYTENGRIVVEGMTDEMSVYNLTGRIVGNEALPTGVYMVKLGNHSARKVVVVR